MIMNRFFGIVISLLALFALSYSQQANGNSSFTDPRDGQTYRTVRIGDKTWMAENLNFKTGESWCYDDKDSNCQEYGRLYDWNTAVSACPFGWRLPDTADWDNLAGAVGGQLDENGGWIIAGEKLKSKIGWCNYYDGTDGNGTDDFGFSALPGGFRSADGSFSSVCLTGDWWSATKYNASRAWGRNIYRGNYFFNGDRDNDDGYSVRCIKK